MVESSVYGKIKFDLKEEKEDGILLKEREIEVFID
jgi:hypothetical protein